MITERTLKRWRKEALVDNKLKVSLTSMDMELSIRIKLNERILCMTQELLDLHLIRK